MGRVPHVHLPHPWPDDEIPLPEAAVRHLTRVLRAGDGTTISYTDGAGIAGTGTLAGEAVRRGGERRVVRPQPQVTVAVAPPKNVDRARFIVEKLAELGVDSLLWLASVRGEGRVPRPERVAAWALAALEQSRGAHRMLVAGPVGWPALPGRVYVATPGGRQLQGVAEPMTIAVGPEGGWAPGEVPPDAPAIGMGERILRVETAAIVAATIALSATGRLAG